jgi:hypothetical protein
MGAGSIAPVLTTGGDAIAIHKEVHVDFEVRGSSDVPSLVARCSDWRCRSGAGALFLSQSSPG